jgi:ribosomal protein S18 acetylase RimI-like enzyme
MSAVEEAGLDNAAYAALSGPHARFAQMRGRALRYPADVAPFFALPPAPSAEDWRCALELVPPGTAAAIVHSGAELPAPWKAVQKFELVQMVGERVTGADAPEAIRLGTNDVPEMLALVEQTQPGPFLEKTIELGDYLGMRRDGQLIAMAGERLRLEGWTEISAVCTAPTHRGQGMASRLMGALIADIQRRGERVFLHVLADNTSAIRLYEELGFRVRRHATLSVLTQAPKPNRET